MVGAKIGVTRNGIYWQGVGFVELLVRLNILHHDFLKVDYQLFHKLRAYAEKL